ncbi:MAG: site-specific DNA-methyltransferase, partial [Proteobacteria bacterium]|nr:site-specific DNA-methyltransferase [Pseudomonadota bacterium]
MNLIKANIETVELPPFDQVVTSPPYYKQRKYSDDPNELGQEKTPAAFIERLAGIFLKLSEGMSDDGTIFINIGDKYQNGVLLGIP